MAPKLRPRGFRFNLRILFAAITIVGVWLGWQVHVVRERREIRSDIMKRGGLVGEATSEAGVTKPIVPIWRRLFGDEPVTSINLDPHAFTEEDRQKIIGLFPEATITGHRIYDGVQTPAER
jgi:hypothetical protein